MGRYFERSSLTALAKWCDEAGSKPQENQRSIDKKAARQRTKKWKYNSIQWRVPVSSDVISDESRLDSRRKQEAYNV